MVVDIEVEVSSRVRRRALPLVMMLDIEFIVVCRERRKRIVNA
jgi:hypothetical protein